MRKTFLIVSMVTLWALVSCQNQPAQTTTEKSGRQGAEKDTACAKTSDSADNTGHISKVLLVSGEVEHPLVLTVDSLTGMHMQTIGDFELVCPGGNKPPEKINCRGVLLTDILNKSAIRQAGHKDHNFYIIARATDNFKATFSWGELYNTETGKHVYVVVEENGQPIREKGEMILICTNDLVTGIRHVYWLHSIEVIKVR